MSNSVIASYRAHRAQVGHGGEGAEWPDLADALASILLARLQELPLDPPLKAAYGFQVTRPGVLPALVVVHDGSVPTPYNACWTAWLHTGHLVLICGPMGADPAAMQSIGTPYIDPIYRVLSENQTLDGRCAKIRVTRAGWGTLPYAGSQWYGLGVSFEIDAYDAWTRNA